MLFEIIRGAKSRWSMSLGSSGGCYELEITPTFIPAHSGHGEDYRELSVMLERCGIVCSNGERIELFTEKVAV